MAPDLKLPPDQAALTPDRMFPACMIRTGAEEKLAKKKHLAAAEPLSFTRAS